LTIRPIPILSTLSRRLAGVEAIAAGLLAAAVAGLILLNVATRTAGAALFWVDELAIYAMVWMAFLGMSITIQRGSGVSVTILTDALPPRLHRAAALLVDGIILAFSVFLLWLCWRWYDPLTLASVSYSVDAFVGETFNFIYREPTQTIGVAKYWVWLIVPLTAAAMTVHALANLLEALRSPHAAQVP
jgi:TRAP-type C4-dicarboxylate transport system permease small subunit